MARCSACESTPSITTSGIALLAEDRRAVLRMLVERRMDLVVEVVEEGDDAPELLVLAEDGARTSAPRPRPRARGGAAAPTSCSASASPRPARGWVFDMRAGRVTAALETAVQDAVRQAFVIEGGHRLSGTVRAAGNKNAALPLLAASLLADEPCRADERSAHPRRRRDARADPRHGRRGRVDGRERGPRQRRGRRRRPSSTRSSATRSAPRSCSPARCSPASDARPCRRRAAT